MSSRNYTDVIIAGKVYTLGGYESEEYLQKVAGYLNGKINELKSVDGFLRQTPDSSNDSNIVATLPRGQFVTRTGIGSNGWSRLDYNGTVVYAVTSLLTTEQ